MTTATDVDNITGHKRKAEDDDDDIINRRLKPRPPPRHFIPKKPPTSSPPASPPQNNCSRTEPDVINTPPPKATQPTNESEDTPPSTIDSSRSVSLDSSGGSIEISEGGSRGPVSVKLEIEAGEYFVKIERRRVTSSSEERYNVEDTKKLAQSASVLFLQAQILRDTGEQLLAKYHDSLQYLVQNSTSDIDFTYP